MCSSRLTACRPSIRPIAEASAAEDVPSASNPASFSMSAEVPSQGFGMMNPPSRSWTPRKRSYSPGCFMLLLQNCPAIIEQLTAADQLDDKLMSAQLNLILCGCLH